MFGLCTGNNTIRHNLIKVYTVKENEHYCISTPLSSTSLTNLRMYRYVNTGSYISVVVSILTDIVGVANVAQAHSLLNLFLTLCFLCSLPIAGAYACEQVRVM